MSRNHVDRGNGAAAAPDAAEASRHATAARTAVVACAGGLTAPSEVKEEARGHERPGAVTAVSSEPPAHQAQTR